MLQRRRIGAALGTILLLFGSLQAAEPPPSGAHLASLIAQLGSPRSEERETATRALEALGAPALPSLWEARLGSDAEVRRRARLLVQRIERRIEATRLLQPTRVRLVYRDTPLREAAADLARKTGLSVQVAGDPARLAGRTVTLDTGDSTLWEAVAHFCQEADLTERISSAGLLDLSHYDPWDRRVVDLENLQNVAADQQENSLLLKDGAAPPLSTFQAGALRLRALPPKMPLASQPRAVGERLIGLEVRLEPRLQLQAVLAVRIDRAIDDLGQTLTQPATSIAGALASGLREELLLAWDGESDLPTDLPSWAGPVAVRLRPAERPARRLKELHGAIALQVPMPPEPLVTVTGLQTGPQVVKGSDGSTVKVTGVQREPGGLVKYRVEVVPAPRDLFLGGFPARIILVTGGRWRGRGLPVPPPVSAGQLALLDERGRKVPLANTPVPTVGSNGAGWDFTLAYQPGPDQAEPARLVYTGRRTVSIEVPFTLQDVPLP